MFFRDTLLLREVWQILVKDNYDREIQYSGLHTVLVICLLYIIGNYIFQAAPSAGLHLGLSNRRH